MAVRCWLFLLLWYSFLWIICSRWIMDHVLLCGLELRSRAAVSSTADAVRKAKYWCRSHYLCVWVWLWRSVYRCVRVFMRQLRSGLGCHSDHFLGLIGSRQDGLVLQTFLHRNTHKKGFPILQNTLWLNVSIEKQFIMLLNLRESIKLSIQT